MQVTIHFNDKVEGRPDSVTFEEAKGTVVESGFYIVDLGETSYGYPVSSIGRIKEGV